MPIGSQVKERAKDKREAAEKLLEAANEAGRTVGALYITFLALATYIGVIIASTTADLRGARLEGANLGMAAIGGADFSQVRLDLADLRGLDRKPLAKEHNETLRAALEQAIGNAQFRASIQERLRAAVGQEVRLPDPLVAPAGPESAGPCLSDGPQPLPGCVTTDAVDEYGAALTDYLLKLVCKDLHIARGVVRRVSEELPSQAALAAALLKADCEGVKALPEDVKKALQEVAAIR